jgi:hypothetical protein
MPVQDCTTEDGRPGRSYGPKGHCYPCDGDDCAEAHRKAEAQGKAIGEHAMSTPVQTDPAKSRFADPPVFEVVGYVAEQGLVAAAGNASPSQARAPKGTPIGGQWIDAVRGVLSDVKNWMLDRGVGDRDEGQAGGSLVEHVGPRVPRTAEGVYVETEPTSTGDDEGVPDIRNDAGMSHKDLDPNAVDPKGRPYGADVVERANDIHTQAILAEPKLTDDMRAAMAGSGGELGGLEYRIKNQSSIAKKIRGNVDEGKPFESQVATDNIKDSVRYTAIFDTGDYASGTQTAIDRLREQGYQVDIKSFYQGPEANLAYKGVHGQMISPEGFKVELQFHTPGSLAAKFSPEMHSVYDMQKLVPKGSAEWEGYEQQMRDYMGTLGFSMPPGADTIK